MYSCGGLRDSMLPLAPHFDVDAFHYTFLELKSVVPYKKSFGKQMFGYLQKVSA
jgi:hypothetical protein